jgi:hypothetical protein
MLGWSRVKSTIDPVFIWSLVGHLIPVCLHLFIRVVTPDCIFTDNIVVSNVCSSKTLQGWSCTLCVILWTAEWMIFIRQEVEIRIE